MSLKYPIIFPVYLSLFFCFIGCSNDIEFSWMIPRDIKISASIFKKRTLGECAVQVFSLDSGFSQTLNAQGLAALQTALTSRKVGRHVSCENQNSCRLNYVSWAQWSPSESAKLGSLLDRKISNTEECLKSQTDAYLAYNSAINGTQMGYFTSVAGSDSDDLLLIIPQKNILIVAPH